MLGVCLLLYLRELQLQQLFLQFFCVVLLLDELLLQLLILLLQKFHLTAELEEHLGVRELGVLLHEFLLLRLLVGLLQGFDFVF